MRIAAQAAPVVVVLLALLGMLLGLGAGCAGCGGSKAPPARGCTLDDGTFLHVGEAGHLDCNECVCGADLKANCTQRACDDAGPAQRDAGPDDEDGGVDGGVDAGPVDEGPCHDSDHDGFYTCIDPDHPERSTTLDCDDERFHVQPGGVEFADTPEDDNCDGSNTDFDTCACDGAATDAHDLGAGMDLCGGFIAAASKTGADVQFGLVDLYQGVIGPRLRARQDAPDEPPVVIGNQCLTTLSSGDALGTAKDVQASVCATAADCPSNASGCDIGFFDETGVCEFPDPDPAAVDADPVIRDLAQLHFTLHAPPNAQGFAFDFMFLSQEWPEYLCLTFNDTFYAIVDDDPAVEDGAPTNAAFDATGRPITVNVGFFENPAAWTVPLDGTTFGALTADTSCTGSSDCFGLNETCDPVAHKCVQGCPQAGEADFQAGCHEPSYCTNGELVVRDGSGSGWLTTTVPVTPGEPVSLTLSIHDEGDAIFDSLVLLDAFRWLPFEPALETAKEER